MIQLRASWGSSLGQDYGQTSLLPTRLLHSQVSPERRSNPSEKMGVMYRCPKMPQRSPSWPWLCQTTTNEAPAAWLTAGLVWSSRNGDRRHSHTVCSHHAGNFRVGTRFSPRVLRSVVSGRCGPLRGPQELHRGRWGDLHGRSSTRARNSSTSQRATDSPRASWRPGRARRWPSPLRTEKTETAALSWRASRRKAGVIW